MNDVTVFRNRFFCFRVRGYKLHSIVRRAAASPFLLFLSLSCSHYIGLRVFSLPLLFPPPFPFLSLSAPHSLFFPTSMFLDCLLIASSLSFLFLCSFSSFSFFFLFLLFFIQYLLLLLLTAFSSLSHFSFFFLSSFCSTLWLITLVVALSSYPSLFLGLVSLLIFSLVLFPVFSSPSLFTIFLSVIPLSVLPLSSLSSLSFAFFLNLSLLHRFPSLPGCFSFRFFSHSFSLSILLHCFLPFLTFLSLFFLSSSLFSHFPICFSRFLSFFHSFLLPIFTFLLCFDLFLLLSPSFFFLFFLSPSSSSSGPSSCASFNPLPLSFLSLFHFSPFSLLSLSASDANPVLSLLHRVCLLSAFGFFLSASCFLPSFSFLFRASY